MNISVLNSLMKEEKAVGFNTCGERSSPGAQRTFGSLQLDKEKKFGEWLLELIKQAELADQRYNVKGFLVHRPNAAITEKVMYRIYEDALERRGHKPARFPSVIPESNFKLEAEHVEGFAPGL